MMSPQKMKHRIAMSPSHPLVGRNAKELKLGHQRENYNSMFSAALSTIAKEVETTQVFLSG